MVVFRKRRKGPKRGFFKKWTTIIFIFLVLIGVVLLFAGRFLAYSESPKKSDVIIVLAGDRGARLVKGASLFKAGYAPRILISGGIIYNVITAADLMKQHALSLGVPKSDVLMEGQSESTYENATDTLHIMKKKRFKSAVVVSSNYHMRRVKMIFDKVYEDSGIDLTYVAATDSEYTPSKWWANNDSILITVNEYIKYLGYMVEY